MTLRQKLIEWLVNWYPPFWGAGIRFLRGSDDWSSVEVELRLHWWNRNYVGVHYGGSLYSLCDPWFMLMLMKQLGPEFIVWDKAASIKFKRPGTGRVRAHFQIAPEITESIRSQALQNGTHEHTFLVQVQDDHGHTIAVVEKLLYVRWKGHHKISASGAQE